MTRRGDVCWADLGEPRGSKPAKRRPVLVIQADPYNASRLNTMLAAVLTSNTGLAAMPGNIFVPAIASGLPGDSVVNVTALVTLDKTDLDPAVGQLPASLMHEVDRGLRRVLGLLTPRPARRSSNSGATQSLPQSACRGACGHQGSPRALSTPDLGRMSCRTRAKACRSSGADTGQGVFAGVCEAVTSIGSHASERIVLYAATEKRQADPRRAGKADIGLAKHGWPPRQSTAAVGVAQPG